MFTAMGIGENLRRIRAERGLSQKALAEQSGVSQQLISQIERGENRTTKELPDLARVLGVGVHQLDESYPAPLPVGDDEILQLIPAIRAAPKPVQDQIISVVKALLKIP